MSFHFSAESFAAGQSQVPKMKLYREFKNAQSAELKLMDSVLKSEKSELKKSQKERQKEWEDEAKIERRKFFEENTEPKKRKDYIQDFMKKRELMKKAFHEELNEQKQEHQTRRKSLQKNHATKLKEFQSALERGEEPSPDLWPERINIQLQNKTSTESERPKDLSAPGSATK